jgi:hypothetical protein
MKNRSFDIKAHFAANTWYTLKKNVHQGSYFGGASNLWLRSKFI